MGFRCPRDLGMYEWVMIPFGLKNASATYQRIMNSMENIDKNQGERETSKEVSYIRGKYYHPSYPWKPF